MMPLAETGLLGATGTLIAALAIGVAFGWCLERGGLGSARKLAGQFYFTDLTVFKVLFSALVTAMLGAFWLDAFGLLNLDLVYVPETFVVPQLLGGSLFGAGFLLAGLCPGTSCVAAAIGRKDGLAVIGGMLVGVFLFNTSYPYIERFYNSTSLGAVTLSELLDISRGAAVAAVTGLALTAFAVVGKPFVTRRQSATPGAVTPLHRRLVLVAVALALAAAVADRRSIDAASLAAEIETERDHISAPDLATMIMNADPSLRVFDLRPQAEFARMHVAGARHATLEALSREPLPRDATIVLYSEGGAHAAQAWVLLRMRGYHRVFFLREGMFEWLARVIEPRLAVDATAAEGAEFARAVEMSRFFGGLAQSGVPRADVPVGYWNSGAEANTPGLPSHSVAARPSANQIVARVRRRGC
jgi:uncharacterized protein